jgi:transposase
VSLQPPLAPPVPELTARVARAAFPKGNPYLRLRDEVGPVFCDADFAKLYPKRGQPALPPWKLALGTVMQFAEDLSDRQAADAVRGRIDWKYALGLELDDPGFNFSVLSEFRSRLTAGGDERFLLDEILEACKDRSLLTARARQRTDSTHVLAATRDLNRLELVGETLRAALNTLATVAPVWLREQAPSEWFDRYAARVEETRLPKGQEARYAHAEAIGADGIASWRPSGATRRRPGCGRCPPSRSCAGSGSSSSTSRATGSAGGRRRTWRRPGSGSTRPTMRRRPSATGGAPRGSGTRST